MARFHLLHCIPNPEWHGLQGYREVIDSVRWGLEQLGHRVSTAVNAPEPGAVNVLFGAQTLSTTALAALPADSIYYNFEQLRGLRPEEIRPELHEIARRFAIWEYCAANGDAWRALGRADVRIVPVGYAPVLARIERPALQDIDVLLYGLSGDRRVNAFHQISHSRLAVAFVSGLYGAARDALIARSKIVLNVSLYEFANLFEVVRASYLFANRKAVVSLRDADTYVEPDLLPAVRWSSLETLADDCAALAADDAARRALEAQAFETFARRDARRILEQALAA